jgi:hypothetical protein
MHGVERTARRFQKTEKSVGIGAELRDLLGLGRLVRCRRGWKLLNLIFDVAQRRLELLPELVPICA